MACQSLRQGVEEGGIAGVVIAVEVEIEDAANAGDRACAGGAGGALVC
jgi:hypothetical protein